MYGCPIHPSGSFSNMRYNFYDSLEYKKKQAEKTKLSWSLGLHDNKRAKIEPRRCKRKNCGKIFSVKTYYKKDFCSQNCAAIHNNLKRDSYTPEWRNKISLALIGKPNKFKGKQLVPRLIRNCLNCGKEFSTPKWQNHKYCCVACSIHDIGIRPTSPKAARAKAGVRLDIDPKLYFFSRWEANFARILNLLKIKWEFQPGTFDLKTQKYTPDFYLKDYDAYIEIKNFLSDYSRKRDEEFRKLYSDKKLILILKEDYLKLQEQFSPHIENWEFS